MIRCQIDSAEHHLSVEKSAVSPFTPHLSTTFLLAQVGAQAANRFAARLEELKLVPAHTGILRAIIVNPGISQQALATMLGLVPSRLVALLDELEEKGLIERRDNADDRRVYALHLTAKGAHTMGEVGRIGRAHEESFCRALDGKERDQLTEFLKRIAQDQGLTPGVHPGYARMYGGDSDAAPQASGSRGRGKAGRRR
jgi:DNA-binding MarR family transcriptional regulator